METEQLSVIIKCGDVSRTVNLSEGDTKKLSSGEVLHLQIGHPGLSQDRLYYEVTPEFHPARPNVPRPMSIVKVKEQSIEDFSRMFLGEATGYNFANRFYFYGLMAQRTDCCIAQSVASGRVFCILYSFFEEVPADEL